MSTLFPLDCWHFQSTKDPKATSFSLAGTGDKTTVVAGENGSTTHFFYKFELLQLKLYFKLKTIINNS